MGPPTNLIQQTFLTPDFRLRPRLYPLGEKVSSNSELPRFSFVCPAKPLISCPGYFPLSPLTISPPCLFQGSHTELLVVLPHVASRHLFHLIVGNFCLFFRFLVLRLLTPANTYVCLPVYIPTSVYTYTCKYTPL